MPNPRKERFLTPRIAPILLAPVFLAALLAPGPLPGSVLPAAEPAPPAQVILERAAQAYRAARTFQIEGDIHAELSAPGGRQSQEIGFRLAVGGPGRVRDEVRHPQSGILKVSDGNRTWIYLTGPNQYMRQEMASPGPDDPGAGSPAAVGGMMGLLVSRLRGLAEQVESVKALPDQTLTVEGRPRPCHVLEVAYRIGQGDDASATPTTLWIDRERHVVLRQRTVVQVPVDAEGAAGEQVETVRFTAVSLGGPVPDSLFSFTPPAGAREVRPPSPQGGDLSGQQAIDFTLPDLSGKRHRLEDQRGKVVLLDFWASWCGPCRVQMPNVEKLHHEFKDRGLVVFAINQGETAEIARRYLEKHKYSAPALIDPKSDVGRKYQLRGIPTLVVIDRQGKVVAHFVGLRPESVLREALKQAGLQ